MFRFFLPSVLIVTFIAIDSTEAQMFNPMTGAQGATFTEQAGWDTDTSNVGSLRGSERFLRKNRSRRDFVGRDVNARQRFVGLVQGQASGEVTSSTAGLNVEMAEDVNTRVTPATASQNYMYDPRLQVDFDVARPDARQTAETIVYRLEEAIPRALCGPIAVTVEEETETAILTGQVATERARELAALIVLLEPGISQIVNELTVVPSPQMPQHP